MGFEARVAAVPGSSAPHLGVTSPGTTYSILVDELRARKGNRSKARSAIRAQISSVRAARQLASDRNAALVATEAETRSVRSQLARRHVRLGPPRRALPQRCWTSAIELTVASRVLVEPDLTPKKSSRCQARAGENPRQVDHTSPGWTMDQHSACCRCSTPERHPAPKYRTEAAQSGTRRRRVRGGALGACVVRWTGGTGGTTYEGLEGCTRTIRSTGGGG